MKDQLAHWNRLHSEQRLHEHSANQTAFAEEVAARLPAASRLLELGCGEGNDSIYFAELGHTVTATDFSDVAIEQNKKRWAHPRLSFTRQNINLPLEFNNAAFDAVYARLSLHYFEDETTQAIFREISRVLKIGGVVCFMCKSTDDSIYGKGEEIEPDMYELNGHVRHFFSEEYSLRLLGQAGLTQQYIETGEEQIYDNQSAFIKVIAQKLARKETGTALSTATYHE